jgi:hypothetical protein
MPPEELHALQIGLSEDIGFGAISKAGALPMGDGMKWLKFVEDKLKRDNRIDHQSLLWELGSEVAENEYIQNGGLNVSLEEDLLRNLSTWFENGGGKLRYVQPSVSKETGITLHALEDIEAGEAVIQIPIKLTMCRISARNVLIKSKGKYLGEELKKTFEKNEVRISQPFPSSSTASSLPLHCLFLCLTPDFFLFSSSVPPSCRCGHSLSSCFTNITKKSMDLDPSGVHIFEHFE